MDIAERDDVFQFLQTMKLDGYDVVVNCAAMTDVWGIETDKDKMLASYRVNVLAPRYLAEACSYLGMRLVHVSTDYVYSEHLNPPIPGLQDEFPVNKYGCHKLMGELYIQREMLGKAYSILRVGCLYGMHREKSFVHRFLKNVCTSLKNGDARPKVQDFQTSTPTPTRYVCRTIAKILRMPLSSNGILSTSPRGCATRYGFAEKILELVKPMEQIHGALDSVQIEKVPWDEAAASAQTAHLPATSMLWASNRRFHIFLGENTWEDELGSFLYENQEDIADFVNRNLKKE